MSIDEDEKRWPLNEMPNLVRKIREIQNSGKSPEEISRMWDEFKNGPKNQKEREEILKATALLTMIEQTQAPPAERVIANTPAHGEVMLKEGEERCVACYGHGTRTERYTDFKSREELTREITCASCNGTGVTKKRSIPRAMEQSDGA